MKLDRIFFEPWGLGDALIAAAVMRECPAGTALACKARWHPVLRAALGPEVILLEAEPVYTTSARKHRGDLDTLTPVLSPEIVRGISVLNIRGDFRDWRAAGRLFPSARRHMSGWVEFLAYHLPLLDIPFALGFCPVRNHYRAWANLAGVPFDKLDNTYRNQQPRTPRTSEIIIHIGARAQSRQYPHVRELCGYLAASGRNVTILAGLSDPLPAGLEENRVCRAADESLVDRLRGAALVIANDSGPMHLAALLGCRTVVVARASNIAKWLPPQARAVCSQKMPRSYRDDPSYNTNQVLDAWPGPEEVIAALGTADPHLPF